MAHRDSPNSPKDLDRSSRSNGHEWRRVRISNSKAEGVGLRSDGVNCIGRLENPRISTDLARPLGNQRLASLRNLGARTNVLGCGTGSQVGPDPVELESLQCSDRGSAETIDQTNFKSSKV